MALSTVIFVGNTAEIYLPLIIEKAKKLKVGYGLESSTDIGYFFILFIFYYFFIFFIFCYLFI
jgi:hypothetical protein